MSLVSVLFLWGLFSAVGMQAQGGQERSDIGQRKFSGYTGLNSCLCTTVCKIMRRNGGFFTKKT